MNILALESSSEACSAALISGDNLIARYRLAPRRHAELLLSMLDELLREAGIEKQALGGLAYGHGPGSFTGVRISAAMVQGISLAHDIPVVGISTLQSMAHLCWRKYGHANILTALDARMREVYFAAYRVESEGKAPLHTEEQLAAPGSVRIPDSGKWVGAGTGWKTYRPELSQGCAPILESVLDYIYPHAMDVALLARQRFLAGQGKSAEQVMPVYLRNKVALTEKERAK